MARRDHFLCEPFLIKGYLCFSVTLNFNFRPKELNGYLGRFLYLLVYSTCFKYWYSSLSVVRIILVLSSKDFSRLSIALKKL